MMTLAKSCIEYSKHDPSQLRADPPASPSANQVMNMRCPCRRQRRTARLAAALDAVSAALTAAAVIGAGSATPLSVGTPHEPKRC